MSPRSLKPGYFVLEGLNSFVTVSYFYYFYFFMQTQFGFGNRANLELAALNGLTYAVGAWLGGRFAQRAGYFTSLKLGFGIMMGALVVGAQVHSAGAHITVMLVTVIGMCFTWPTLEALISEGETRAGVQHMVGIYNVVWAGTAALANFCGGAMLDKLGLKSLFYVPAAILLCQLALTFRLQAQARQAGCSLLAPHLAPGTGDGAAEDSELAAPRPAKARNFLRMAWLANPCAYIAIQTLVAVVPGVARRLELSTTLAGFLCSAWCFARAGSFIVLWKWNGWHYRFRWMLLAYLAMVGTFAAVLLAPNLVVLVAAQLVFGVAVGLIYYSSLFYSMDRSETKGEHGGIHEAAIGLGNFAGPAVGAASLYFLPQYANSGALAVTGLLTLGLGGLLALWRSGTEVQSPESKIQSPDSIIGTPS